MVSEHNYAVVGRNLKRLLSFQPVMPVVPRWTKDEKKFALSDLSDCEAGRFVLRTPPLQLAMAEDVEFAPFCLDIDQVASSKTDGEKVVLSEVPNAVLRAKLAARLVSTVLLHGFGLKVHWFGSGKQGMHGFCFVGLTKDQRREIAHILLPTGPNTIRRTLEKGMEYYKHPAVAAVTTASLKLLSALDTSTDLVFSGLLKRAMAPDAEYIDKLIAVSAYYDTQTPTIAARIRVPCAWNEKDGAFYAGFPLPPFTHDWPQSLVRRRDEPLSHAELSLLSSIQLPSPSETQRAIDLCSALCPVKKRSRTAGQIPVRLRLGIVNIQLHPEGSAARRALLPAKILPFLTEEAVRALEDGVRRGGIPPALWHPEPNTERRMGFVTRGGGLGNDPQLPLALLALTGLDLPSEGRAAVALSLFTSHFPVDAFAEAMCANAHRMRQFQHWSSFFLTCAKGKNREGAYAFLYECGRFEQAGIQCENVRTHCARAAAILDPHCCRLDKQGRIAHKGTVLEDRDFTGRVVTLKLDRSMAEVTADVESRLRTRAVNVAEATRLCKRARASLRHVYDAVDDDGIVRFSEYIESGGRYGFIVRSFSGIKSVLAEVRRVLFRGYWRADISRCHTTMLVGSYLRARTREPNDVRANALLERLHCDLEGVESEIRADQLRLRPDALKRLKACVFGSKAEAYALKFLGYLDSKPKVVLSALLNHADDSPMFRGKWKLASDLCVAFGVAARHAKEHPLVLMDAKRPQASGIASGAKGEKSRVACLLERNAVKTLQETLTQLGATPSVSVNDDVLYSCDWDESAVESLESKLAAAVSSELGFGVKVCVGKVA
jgi:hypothetical protein